MSESDNILEMRGITKEFPGVKALDNVNFVVRRGSIHALVGENGAGKSTTIKLIMNAIRKDGELPSYYNSWSADFNDPDNFLYTFFSKKNIKRNS